MSFYYAQKPFELYGKTLIETVDIQIQQGNHVALIGDNGVGKTTLLTAIHNKYPDDTYLMHQNLAMYGEEHALDYIMSVDATLLTLKRKMTQDLDALGEFIDLSGYEFEQDILTKAKLFQLSASDLDKKVKELSGGQQTKIAIIRALMSNKPCLLLDEPTNHLDSHMVTLLANMINESKQTILLVSHLRSFINIVASQIIEITSQKTTMYEGNYENYEQIKAIEQQSQVKAFEKAQKEINDLKSSMDQVQRWHASAKAKASVRNPYEQKKLSKLMKRAKAKETQLTHKINEQDIVNPNQHDVTQYQFQETDTFQNKYLLQFDQMGYDINNTCLYHQVNLNIRKGENILVTGNNGSGKSVLVDIITGKRAPTTGTVKHSPSLKIACFDQKHDNLADNLSPKDLVMKLEGMTNSHAQTILSAFQFTTDQILQPIKHLSMGEKSRLQFVLLYFASPHLLILDEPTNYFDIRTQKLIMSMIESFNGQVFIVSHDAAIISEFQATHWHIENKTIVNKDLEVKEDFNIEATKNLLEDYKDIDAFGNFQTDN